MPRARQAEFWFNRAQSRSPANDFVSNGPPVREKSMSHPAARTIFAVALSVLATSGAVAAPAEKLGSVSFANSCSEAVQPHLQRAVALLHSFWWSEGDKAFRDVLQRDPPCAVAGWGIAAILIGNPYASGATPDGAKKAQEAIAQARGTGAKTERERGYIEA